jgi:hypothetical protein
MTPPKRWPNHAEWARLEAVAIARRIRERTLEAQAALERNNRLLAAAILADIRSDATEIVAMLINVKGGTMKEDPGIERLKQQNEKLEREIRETKELIERLLKEKGEKR